MAWWEDKAQELFAAIFRGASGIKLGPGVLGTIVPINTVGIIAIAVITYALSAHPPYAFAALFLGLAFLVYANERAFRYADKNPIPALMGGSELLQFFREQRGARDKSLSVDDAPVLGASVAAIEHKDDGDV